MLLQYSRNNVFTIIQDFSDSQAKITKFAFLKGKKTNNWLKFRKTKNESNLRHAFGFGTFVRMAKIFKMLIIYCGKKSPQKYWHIHKPSLQHFFKMMSKMWENDGYWCFTKMLSFVRKRLKMLEFTQRIDLLFSDNLHFAF